ncbi:M20/M25/M40 family metallo-hydrolase [uncultured Kocuria sp.]|uniref:M20/M25/M40 family metallo-hydrolase n=1 Tax=uncultured Kocuria sp. TaxID=259305 RepID=UPI00262CA224|nr:M20/M25/M40 family metallo-hydrolase [uncultured Kocuria sp.]
MPVRKPSHWITSAALAGALTLTATSAVAAPTRDNSNNNTTHKITQAVTQQKLTQHLNAFQSIAEANDGNRASGTSGYQASVDYVVQKLRAAGYTPEVQEFTFPYFQEVTPATVAADGTQLAAEDVAVMTYSGTGTVSGTVQAVDTDGTAGASTSGCEAEDFADFVPGNIALIQRGACSFAVKAANAEAAGASAVLIFNSGAPGSEGLLDGTLGSPEATTLPTVGLSHQAGVDLLDATEVTVVTDTVSATRTTYNVLAETGTGDPENTVVVGAHLDGVLEGAGISDNGTGSAGILAIAEAMAKTKTENNVRFAWWGAEELGLLGAEHYVTDLQANDPGALEDIALYLNFDMIGSPNYGRFVYDGDASAFDPGDTNVPAGSGAIEAAFHEYFASAGLTSGETEFSGRSDYGPFIEVGVPSGGLFTGAEGVKTEEQAVLFGGQAGVAYDSCYHSACDDITNVNLQGMEEMSDAAAAVVLRYAMSTHDVNGEGEPYKQKGKGAVGHPQGKDRGHGPHSEHGRGHGHGHDKAAA